MKRLLALSSLALAITLSASPARAGSASSTLTVEANVLGYCTIANQTFTFVDYDPTAVGDHDADSGTIAVSCTQDTTFWITLDGTGTMQHTVTSEPLSYELYRDPTRTELYDVTEPVGYHTTAGLAGLAGYTVDVFGRIPAAQVVSAGSYTGTVPVTVNF